ncbi:hypothetical protein ACFCV3_17980 [Kribbella sp. NPDC056345]|uniref:hypothetical protein n=1 Tax=Kribbella sp. NPDC056345 TaxID=3345789 RepID=UPI0035DC4DA1
MTAIVLVSGTSEGVAADIDRATSYDAGGTASAGRIGGPVEAGQVAPPAPAGRRAVDAGSRSTVARHGVPVPAGYYWRIWVYCPAGTKATGGGASTHGYPTGLHASKAIDGGNGWEITVSNNATIDVYAWVEAVCVSGLTYYSLHTATSSVAGGQINATAVLCPRGVMTGGGGWADTNNVSLRSNRPHSLTGWVLSLRNRDADRRGFTVQVVCVEGVQNVQHVESGWQPIVNGLDRIVFTDACAPGQSRLGGGADAPAIVSSSPYDVFEGNTNWVVTGVVDGAPTGNVRAVLICGT